MAKSATTDMFKVATASEYLVISGRDIPDIKLAKKSWVLPGQSYSVLDLSPVNYTFEDQTMSAEKRPFILPAVFTIGPRVDDEEALFKYAKLISSHDKNSNYTKELVQGIIERETRVLAASMTMEEIFKGTKEFKQKVFGKVQLELNQFGLLIYNANVKQLGDVRGQKTQTEAANLAKSDLAEARMKGEIGSKLRDGQTLQNAAKIDAETKIVATQRQGDGKKEEIRVKTDVKVYENQREAKVAEANAELPKKKAGWAEEAQVEPLKAAVERMSASTRTEKLSAEFLSKASVEYETKVQGVRSKLGSKEAVAQKAMAEAAFYTGQQGADGELNAKQKEAEGLVALAKAQGAWTNDNGGSGAMDGAACSGSSALKEVAGMPPSPILVSITVKPKIICHFNNINNNNNNNIING